MNKFNLALIAAGAFTFASCGNSNTETVATEEAADSAATPTVESVAYTVDTENSSITWKGSKVTGDYHVGTINIKEGTLNSEEGAITAGNFVIDMTSMDETTEGASEEMEGKFLGHLASDDFFSVDSNKTATFEITNIEGNNISGNLTIKGITNQITFPADVTVTEGKLTANASFSFDRTKWDVRYGSGKFFDDLGDKMINDAVEIQVNLVANAN